MSNPLLVREFDVQDEDPRFWIELVVFYYPNIQLTEIRLRGSERAVMTIRGDDVLDIRGELLGHLVVDVVPTTLDLLLAFEPEPHVDGIKLMKFSASSEEYYDFAILIFKSLKNLQYE